MDKFSQVAVLAEDLRHQRLVRQYLYRLKYTSHDILLKPLPGGRGCGEQSVREQYASAVRAYRARSHRARSALIVVIDADAEDAGPARRIRQFEKALVQAELASRGDEETIVHLVPRRNIETWILCRNGRQVDEEWDYSQERNIDQQISSAAAKLFEWTRRDAALPGHCVPSLIEGIRELKKLDPL